MMKRLRTPHGYIFAEQIVDGVAVNPKLPDDFDYTPNEDRPASHRKFWFVPYIVTESVERLDAFYANRTDEWADEGRRQWAEKDRSRWLEVWPGGTRYDVRCLDGGAWDRSTACGWFANLEEAVACAKARRP